MVSKVEQEKAIERLREILKPGDTVYAVLRHVSRSGMSRVIDLKVLDCTDRVRPMLHIGYNAALATDMTYDRQREGIKIGGCGMDMGFALVYALSYMLFPDGFQCVGEGCPANNHSNGDRDYTPHLHHDGGYALKFAWI